MSTQEQRQEWRELVAAVQDDMNGVLVAGKTTQERNYRVISTTSAGWLADCYTEEIANLLVAARTAIPALLADVDALTAEVARLMEAGRDMQEQRNGWKEEAEIVLKSRQSLMAQLGKEAARADAIAAELERVRAQLDAAVQEKMEWKAKARHYQNEHEKLGRDIGEQLFGA